MHWKKGIEMKNNYTIFKNNMEKKLPDFKPNERIAYMLRHPVHLKQCGGNYQLLADYMMMEVK